MKCMKMRHDLTLTNAALTAAALMLVFLVPVSRAANAEEARPEASALVRGYVEALNTGERPAVRAFLEANADPAVAERIPMAHLVTMNLAFFYRTGGLGYDIGGDVTAGGQGAAVKVRNRLTGVWCDLSAPLSMDGPPRINGLCAMRPSTPPEDVSAPAAGSAAGFVDAMDRVMARLVEDDEFSGSVLVEKDGRPLYRGAFGMADRDAGAPNRPGTKFNIASVGKMFTGVAVARLVEDGAVSLDDPVGKDLPPGWIDPGAGERITIRHLLTHTAGFGSYFRRLYQSKEPAVYRGIDDYRELIAGEQPSFPPGERFSYSNTGMHLLGVMIGHVAGESYYDYVREHVFEPAGMDDTGFWDKDAPLDDRAEPCMRDPRVDSIERGPFTQNRVMRGGPSGGGYSTVDDLARFARALMSHELLGPAMTEEAVTPKPETGAPHYGYGFFVFDGEVGRTVEHAGNGMGVSAVFRIYRDLGFTVAVLSNYDRPAADIVADTIHQLILAGGTADIGG